MGSSEQIPDVCNEFILCYCEARQENPTMPAREDLVEITDHMCNWFFSTF